LSVNIIVGRVIDLIIVEKIRRNDGIRLEVLGWLIRRLVVRDSHGHKLVD